MAPGTAPARAATWTGAASLAGTRDREPWHDPHLQHLCWIFGDLSLEDRLPLPGENLVYRTQSSALSPKPHLFCSFLGFVWVITLIDYAEGSEGLFLKP